MTDNQQWQAPGGQNPPAVPPVVPQQPPVAPPVALPAPGYSAPQPGYGYPQQGGQQQGWTPAPRPGLIPLQPLDLGGILGASFRVMRRNPRPTFGIAVLVHGVLSIVELFVAGFVAYSSVARIESASSEDLAQVSAGSVVLSLLSTLIPALLSLIATAIVQGIVVLEVARGTIGEKLTFRQLWAWAKGRLWALIGWTLLLVAAIAIGFGILVGLIVVLVTTLGVAGIIVGVLVGLIGAAGAAVLGVWLSTKLALVPSVLMVERLSLRDSIARSWGLTKNYFWRTFGITLLVAFIFGVVSEIAGLPLAFATTQLTTLIDPNGQANQTFTTVAIVLGVVGLILTIGIGAISMIVSSATTALIYIDLRIRKEGLDLELARFVEARQAGDSTVPDPYYTRPAATHPA